MRIDASRFKLKQDELFIYIANVELPEEIIFKDVCYSKLLRIAMKIFK